MKLEFHYYFKSLNICKLQAKLLSFSELCKRLHQTLKRNFREEQDKELRTDTKRAHKQSNVCAHSEMRNFIFLKAFTLIFTLTYIRLTQLCHLFLKLLCFYISIITRLYAEMRIN